MIGRETTNWLSIFHCNFQFMYTWKIFQYFQLFFKLTRKKFWFSFGILQKFEINRKNYKFLDYLVSIEDFFKFLVYIFLGTAMSLIDFMNAMQNQRLLDHGEYMVIHVDMMTYSSREAQKYLWSRYFHPFFPARMLFSLLFAYEKRKKTKKWFFDNFRARTFWQSQGLPRTEGLSQACALIVGCRIDTSDAKLWGIHEKGPRVQ